jgi:hypothetical protein
MDVEEALARIEIQAVLWRYARGVDRGDYETMASVYYPEAIDDHGVFTGPGTEFARFITEREERFPVVGHHHITNITLVMDGPDDARVESYFLAFHPHRRRGVYRLAIASGRYLDHFQRRDGEWKILHRRVVMDWTRDHVDGEPWAIADGRPEQGARKLTGDSSYEFLGER